MSNYSGDNPKLLLSAFGYVLVALFLMAYSSSHPKVAQSGFVALSIISAPVQSVLTTSTSSIGDLVSNYFFLINVKKENKELSKRLQSLRSRNARLQEARHENKRLKRLLRMKDQFNLSEQAANIIGSDPNHWTREIVLDRGSETDIAIGSAVVSDGGVVGQIVSVGLGASKALLMTDTTRGVDAVIQGTRARGIVEGDGHLAARWRFVLAEEPVKVGDKLVTSGLDGVFPAGLPVGTISDVIDQGEGLLFQEVIVSPTVNFSKLEQVLILDSAQSKPLDKLNLTTKDDEQ